MILKNTKLKAKTRSDLEERGFLKCPFTGYPCLCVRTGRRLLLGETLPGRRISHTKTRPFLVDAEVFPCVLAGGARQARGAVLGGRCSPLTTIKPELKSWVMGSKPGTFKTSPKLVVLMFSLLQSLGAAGERGIAVLPALTGSWAGGISERAVKRSGF